MYFVFIEDESSSVEALRILLERKKVRSTVVANAEKALELCEEKRKITCMVANPHCLGEDLMSFLQSTSRASIPVIVYDHIDESVSMTEYPSHVAQVIPKNASVATACMQFISAGRQLQNQQLLESRHSALSVTLGLEKDLSRVIFVYSTILDMDYDKVRNMVTQLARRTRVSMSHIVDIHKNYLQELDDHPFAASIQNCGIEAPILRELTIGSRIASNKEKSAEK